nr:hypothetical protein [uncultured Acetatifactor sp.]
MDSGQEEVNSYPREGHDWIAAAEGGESRDRHGSDPWQQMRADRIFVSPLFLFSARVFPAKTQNMGNGLSFQPSLKEPKYH